MPKTKSNKKVSIDDTPVIDKSIKKPPVKKPKVPTSTATPKAPRKKSAYLEFISKARSSVAKKNPGLGPKDMMRKLAEEYRTSKNK